MLTNESCTLYLKNGNGFDRYYIAQCHWQESKATNVTKSGMAGADGVVVYIFKKDIPAALVSLIEARNDAAQDIIVRGECDFTFVNSTQQSVSQGLKTFTAAYDAHTVMSYDKLLYGSSKLQHFKLSAR